MSFPDGQGPEVRVRDCAAKHQERLWKSWVKARLRKKKEEELNMRIANMAYSLSSHSDRREKGEEPLPGGMRR